MRVDNCVGCRFWRKIAENLGLCERFNIEIWVSIAKKVALCRDFELHHEMPSGRLVPVKRVVKK